MKKTTIHTPKLAAIKFIGNFQKKLFEIGARKLPILSTGDIVIVNEIEAILLLRQQHFQKVDIETLFVSENEETGLKDVEEDNTSVIETIKEKNKLEILNVEINLPFKEDLESLTEEQIKEACKKVGIKTGKKTIDTLKAILLAYLPTKKT